MAWLRIPEEAQNAMVEVLRTLINAGSGAGTLTIYDGEPPSSLDEEVGAQVALSEHAFQDPAFSASVGGVAATTDISVETSAPATGTATWARIADSDGVAVMDMDVGESAATLILKNASITIGDTIYVSEGQIFMPPG